VKIGEREYFLSMVVICVISINKDYMCDLNSRSIFKYRNNAAGFF